MNNSFEATKKEYPLFYPMSIALLGVLIGILIGGFFFSEQVDAYAMNLFTEGISITLTVFVIDLLNRNQVEQRDIQNCAFLMSSKDNAVAIQAVELAKSRNWLKTGAFKGKNFCDAALAGARLGFDRHNRDCGRNQLAGAKFKDANLNGAFFHHCDLQGAEFQQAKLQKVNFYDADITGADFSGANLYWANFERARGINDAIFSVDTIMPNNEHFSKTMDLSQFTDRYCQDGTPNPEFHKHGPYKPEDVPYVIEENKTINPDCP